MAEQTKQLGTQPEATTGKAIAVVVLGIVMTLMVIGMVSCLNHINHPERYMSDQEWKEHLDRLEAEADAKLDRALGRGNGFVELTKQELKYRNGTDDGVITLWSYKITVKNKTDRPQLFNAEISVHDEQDFEVGGIIDTNLSLRPNETRSFTGTVTSHTRDKRVTLHAKIL